jgi:hypothetical protein
MKKEERKELTDAELAEFFSDPFIQNQLEKIMDYLTTIAAIRKREGQDASKESVRSFAEAKMDEQLAKSRILAKGLAADDLTPEEIETLSSQEFEQEVLRKAVNCE